MSLYVTDAHPLIWYATQRHRRLSRKALRIFRQADHDQALIYVPAPVLLEISMLLKLHAIQLDQPFAGWGALLFSKRGFDWAPLELEVIDEALKFSFNNDPFDLTIAATASIRNLPLITRDAEIVEADVVEIAW